MQIKLGDHGYVKDLVGKPRPFLYEVCGVPSPNTLELCPVPREPGSSAILICFIEDWVPEQEFTPKPTQSGTTLGADGPINLLEEARRLIYVDRNASYGSFYHEASKTTFITSMILENSKHKWTPQQRFGLERVVHKLVRAGHSYKRDNFVDAAGYLELLNRMFEDGNEPA